MEISTLAVDELRPSKDQPADRAKNIADLAESIKAIGIMIPLIVRPAEKGIHEIIAGHRRYAVAKQLGIQTLPCIISKVDVEEAQVRRMAENMQRLNLTPMQEAAEIKRLVDKGWDFAKISVELGMTPRYLARRAKLINLSPDWMKFLTTKRNAPEFDEDPAVVWTPAHLEMIARYNHQQQDRLLERFRYDSPTIEGLKRELSEEEHELALAPWDLADETLVPVAGACLACSKRSGCEPLLFDDMIGKKKAGDRCLDSDCWNGKMKMTIAKKQAALLEEHPKIVKISHEYTGEKDVVSKDRFKQVAKGTKGAIPAMYIDGADAGELRWIQAAGSGVQEIKKKAKGTFTDKDRADRLRGRRAMHIIDQVLLILGQSKKPEGLLKSETNGTVRLHTCLRLAVTFGLGSSYPFDNREWGWSRFSRDIKKGAQETIADFWQAFAKEAAGRIRMEASNGEAAIKLTKKLGPLLDLAGIDMKDLETKAAADLPDKHGVLAGKAIPIQATTRTKKAGKDKKRGK